MLFLVTCGRQTELLDERSTVISKQIGEFHSKYSLSYPGTISLNQLIKSSPSAIAHKKIHSGQLSLFSVCKDNDKDFTDSFQPLAATVDTAECNSSQPMEVMELVPQEALSLPTAKDPRKKHSKKVPVQV